MKTFTVTIAGSERHDGEKPYDYVIEAETAEAAAKAVTVEFAKQQWDANDIVVVGVKEGAPPPGYRYHWNDMRPVLKLNCFERFAAGHFLSDDDAIAGAESFDALLADIKAGKVTLWRPFENCEYGEVVGYMQDMVDDLSRTFAKVR